MLSLSAEQLISWFNFYIWPFMRLLALFSTAPFFGEQQIPMRLKILLAATISILVAPILPTGPTISPFSWLGIWILAREILIGFCLGWIMRLTLVAVQAAGEYIGLQMGLSFASFYSPETGGNTTVLSRWLNILTLLMMLSLNIHLILLQFLISSFFILPISDQPLSASGFMMLAKFGSHLFIAGLLLAMPLIAALLLINIAMAILNRASPQFSVYTVGFPITLLGGLILLMTLFPQQGSYFYNLFTQALEYNQRLLNALY